MTLEASPIPLIDLSTGASTEELAKAIASAVSSVGFLHVKLPQDGGLSVDSVRRAFAISRELFEEPIEHRLACPNKDGNGHVRFQANRLEESKGAGDLKENFVFGRRTLVPGTTQPLPPSLKKNKEEAQAFHDSCFDLSCQLLDAFSIALNLPKNFFRERHASGFNGLAFIHYPAVSPGPDSEESAGVARASAHKDWGSLTLLFQEEQGTPGLEVFLPDAAVEAAQSDSPFQLMADIDLKKGKWFPAPIIPGTVLVNLGLALEGWTGGLFKATLHRVITQQTPEGGYKQRFSIAYFVQPVDEVVLNPISPDGTIDVTPGAQTSRDFYEARMAASQAAALA